MLQMKLFTIQVIPLAFCFGVAYWLLITANVQEGNLKSLGKTLGWSIITLSVISSFFGYYLLNNSSYVSEDYSGYRMNQPCQGFGPMMEKPKFPGVKMEQLKKNMDEKEVSDKEDEVSDKAPKVEEKYEQKVAPKKSK